MRLIRPSYKILAGSGKSDILPYNYESSEKLIELAGRICYKSEENITDNSANEFLDKIKKRKHLSVFEHSWKYKFYKHNVPFYKYLHYLETPQGTLVAGNFRAFEEWNYNHQMNCDESFKDYQIIYKYKRWDMLAASVKFIIDRGTSHELVRHRPVSYNQESTRYCNYSKDKFNNQITFIIPPWCDIDEGEYNDTKSYNEYKETNECWLKHMFETEVNYKILLDKGWSPQQARSILPNSLKTEIIVTTNLQEWIHIFNLRALGITGAPHPQMLEVMQPLYSEFRNLFPEVFM